MRLLRYVVLTLVGAILFLGSSQVAWAATVTGPTPGTTGNGVTVLGYVLDTGSTISFAIGTILPLIVAAVTKANLNATLKGVLHLGLSAATAFLSLWLQSITANQHFAYQAAIVSTLVTFTVGLLSHNYVFKPGGFDKLIASNIGPKVTPPEEPVAYVPPAAVVPQ